MTAPRRCGLHATLVTVALMYACPAVAQMIPVTDLRQTAADATYHGVNVAEQHFPAAPFASFEDNYEAYVEDPDGSCNAYTFQTSLFFPTLLYGAGHANGGWGGAPGASYLSWSLLRLRVRWETCLQYDLDATLVRADGIPYFEVRSAAGAGRYLFYDNGHNVLSGRLPAGDYVFEAHCTAGVDAQYFDGGTWEFTWMTQPCASLIATHPQNATVASGGTTSLSVVPAGPGPNGFSTAAPSAATYQWRKNLVPLANDGHFTGVTTSTLTLHAAAPTDTGSYDVVLTDGSIQEPSQLARLSVNGTTDVGLPSGPADFLTLAAPLPNPSRTSTSFRYAVRQPIHASAAIHDASGRVVRRLANRVLSGQGSLTWDGTTEIGTQAAPGIYFLRVVAQGQVFARRFARIH